ncbi:MAG: PASTA domain-containing protein [Gammaproteobacteria bacterium]|nr:PASTA domain-containing protein [Gammaproteobacteria bacterium]
MELNITATLVDEKSAPLVSTRVYVYAYTSAAKLTLIATGLTDEKGVASLTTSHELVQDVQPRLLLRCYDKSAAAYRYLTDQVQSYTATTAAFGTLTVKSTATVKVSATSFYAVNASMMSLSAAALDVEKTALRGEVDTLNSSVSRLTADKSDLERQVSSLSADKSTLAAQVSSLTTSKRSLETSVRTLNSEKVALQASVDSLGQSAGRLQTQLGAAVSERDALKTQVGTLEQDVTDKASQLRSLTASLARARSDKSTLTEQLNQALTEKADSLARLQTQHDELLTRKQQEIARLGAQVEEYEKAAGAETNLRDLVLNTASQLETARAGVKQLGKNYRLGNISMKLKVAPGPTGSGFSFLKKDEVNAANAGALSEISIDFPSEDDKQAAAPQRVPAPRLIGYTETMAQRKLQPYGLNLDVAYQVVPDGDAGEGMVGRVLRQIPEAGNGELEAGSTITVFIGKAVSAAEA